MRSHEFVWTQDNIDHIARHGVLPAEVEEVCRGHHWVLRVRSEGANPVYNIRGQTEAGRYLTCLLIRFPDDKWCPITARTMTDNEKTAYRRRRRT